MNLNQFEKSIYTKVKTINKASIFYKSCFEDILTNFEEKNVQLFILKEINDT